MDGKLFCARTPVFGLVLVLLLSSMMGTIVWAKRPPTPPPQPETDTFQIDIGTEGQDVVLTSPEIGYLITEAYVDGFLPPPTEPGRKTQAWSWSAYLNELWPPESTDECGVYAVNLAGVPSEIDAQYFMISHAWVSRPKPVDYWEFLISWGNYPDTMNPGDAWALSVRTNQDFTPEGAYDAMNEKWTINFNGASWELIDFEPDPDNPGCAIGYPVDSGIIIYGLTVTIDKIT